MLRIDLLPEHFAQARAARGWLVVMVIVLLATVFVCFGVLMVQKANLKAVEEDLAKWDADAKKVEAVQAEIASVNALAAPISGKVDFIDEADKSGEQFWAAFDKVNRYIYSRARMLNFTITPPNAVRFQVELPDTTSVGRFVLNLIRCPDITATRFGGSVPGGPPVGPNASGAAPGGGGGMMGPGMMGGAPGAGGMGMPGGMPGAGPMMGGGRPGGGGAPSGGAVAGGPITLSVDAQLVKAISVPAPGAGAAAAAAPGGGMMGGAPGGMMGGGAPGGMMGGGAPGAMGPGGGGAGPPGPPAGGAGGASKSDAGGGAGGIGKRDTGGGDE